MDVNRWVNDELHTIFGISDKILATFIISTAQRSQSADAFLNTLRETDSDVANNPKMRQFAQQLLIKVAKPTRSAPTSRQPTAQQLKLLELERHNARLQALSDESDDDAPATIPQSKKKDDKKASKNLRKRKESSSEDEVSFDRFSNGNQEYHNFQVVIPRRNQQAKQEFDDGSDADIEKIIAEDDEDAAERDAFATRLREHDKKKTRQIVSKSDAKAAAEAAKRLNIAGTDDSKTLIHSARHESRKQYLEKRKADKTYELERLVAEESQMFDESELTAKERADLEYKRNVLQYVTKYDQAGNVLKKQRYHVPDASTKSIPTEYVEEEEHPGGDGRRWEEERLTAAVFKAGARNKIVSSKILCRYNENCFQKEDFSDELLIEDEIDFVQAFAMPGSNDDVKPELTAKQKKKLSLEETRKSLPVFAFRDDFIKAVRENQVIIIEGETGSGKTTQLPQYLYEAGFCEGNKRIGCTQPRRVAAMSVAARVAEEMNTKIGALVGYSIRFEDCTSERTMIKYMTDGMLLREFLNEPDLASYSVMMIDEAHERTLHTDILFGLVKDIAR